MNSDRILSGQATPRTGGRQTARVARWLAAAVAVAGGVFLALPAWAGFSVPAQVSVDAENVTLGDLVSGAPPEWSRVALGRGPRPGGERTLDRVWILQRARQVGAQDALEVPETVVLTRPGQTLGREDVIRRVETVLAPRLGPEERARVVSVGLPGPVPSGALELDVRLPEGPLPSPVTLWVDVLVSGERSGRAWARVEVYRSRPVLRVTRNLRRGDLVTAGDLEVRSGDASFGSLSDPSLAVGKILARSLRSGDAVTARDLETPTVVDRGDVVRLVARVGGVTASTLGKTLESGGLGDTLRVENLVSGRTVTGVLRDGGVVDVASGLRR